MQCKLCGIELEKGEAILCSQCVEFIEWKYGSLEKFQEKRNKEVGK